MDIPASKRLVVDFNLDTPTSKRPTPLKKNLNTHPLANMKVKQVQQDRVVARTVFQDVFCLFFLLSGLDVLMKGWPHHRDVKGP